MICDQPYPTTELRQRLWHGLHVINTFLVLVLAFQLTDAQRHFWKTLLGNWLECLVEMRGSARRRELRVSPSLYLLHAWEGPFEGRERESVGGLVAQADELLGENAIRNAHSIDELVQAVCAWHEEIARTIGTGHDIKHFAFRL